MSRERLEESMAGSLRAAMAARAKENERLERMNIGNALGSLLAIAASEYKDPRDGIAHMCDRNCIGLLKRFTELNHSSYLKLQSRIRPYAEVALSPEILHIAWLVGNEGSSNTLLEIFGDEFARKLWGGEPLWREYLCSLHALGTHNAYSVQKRKYLRAYDKYIAAYISWISDITNEREASQSLSLVEELFVKRQHDKRQFLREFDGGPYHPAFWDFRIVSVQVFLGWPNKSLQPTRKDGARLS